MRSPLLLVLAGLGACVVVSGCTASGDVEGAIAVGADPDAEGVADTAAPNDDATSSTDSPPSDAGAPRPDSATSPDSRPPEIDASAPPVPGAVYGAKCSGMSANETEAWTEIAIIRGKAKMGALDCIDAIQTSARNHAHYSELNGWILTHQEDPTKPGYTGVQFWDRMTAAGFSGPGSPMFEVAHSTGDAKAAILGDSGWVNTLYHRIAFVSFGAHGYGFGGAGGGYPGSAVIDFANGGSAPSSSVISTWPVDGDTGVWTTFRCASEIPNPLPGKTVAGYPVSITGGGAVDVTTHTLTDPSGAALDHVLITTKNDPASFVPKEQAYLIASAPLAASTRYVAHFAGTVGGAPFDTTFSFTTQ